MRHPVQCSTARLRPPLRPQSPHVLLTTQALWSIVHLQARRALCPLGLEQQIIPLKPVDLLPLAISQGSLTTKQMRLLIKLSTERSMVPLQNLFHGPWTIT